MRLFFAAFPDLQTSQRIASAARALDLHGAARNQPPENYHLTILFLGEVSQKLLQSFREIGATQGAPCFSLRFDRWE